MNIVITDKDMKKINYFLNKMLSSSMAHSVLLIDRSGQLIAHHGNTPELDILSLSALTATLLFHKGKNENVYFSAVGEHVIMVTLFDDQTSLGLIRLQINKIIDELSTILLSIFEKGRSKSSDPLRLS
jgi:hypothetical protein